jgi:hypothetical protein
MTLRLGGIDADARYAAWISVVQRIHKEHVKRAWGYYMFRLVRAVFTTNERLLEEGGFVFNWVAENYVEATLMLVRRELDKQAGVENLKNLLLDMIENPTVITRARYLTSWGHDGPFDRWHANQVFDGFNPVRIVGDPEADHIDPAIVRADLKRVDASAEGLREYAERTRAHRTPGPAIDTAGMTFSALHDAINDMRDVIAKYYALLTLSSLAQWEPVPQFNTFAPFTRPWLTDRSAVEHAVREPRRT